MKLALPFMPFFTDKWLLSVNRRAMSLEQQAAYLNLLAQAWRLDGYLPNDPAKLWRLAECNSQEHFESICDPIIAMFETDDEGRLFNQTLIEVLAEQQTKAANRKKIASMGGNARTKVLAASRLLADGKQTASYKEGEKRKRREEGEESTPALFELESSTSADAEVEPAGAKDYVDKETQTVVTRATLLKTSRDLFDYFVVAAKKPKRIYTYTKDRASWTYERLWDALVMSRGDLETAVNLFKLALDNLLASPWHAGRNPKGKLYQNYEYVVKTPEDFQKWIQESQR